MKDLTGSEFSDDGRKNGVQVETNLGCARSRKAMAHTPALLMDRWRNDRAGASPNLRE